MPIGISGKQLAGPTTKRVGEAVGGPLFVFKKSVAGATTAWTVVKSLEFPVDVIGMIVHCTATNSNGDVYLTDGTNTISGTVTCDTADQVTGIGDLDGAAAPFTMDMTYISVAKGGTLALVTSNSAEGDVYIICVKKE